MRNFTSLAHVGPSDSLVPWFPEEDVLQDIEALLEDEDEESRISEFQTVETNSQYINTTDSWQISLLVISSVNVSLISLYWLYILYVSYMKTTRWRPPLLPHTLLFGLLLASAAGFPHLTPELKGGCQGARMCTSLSYTIVYSSLLVRLVCLRSLHRGIFLPIPYQALLLLFCILVQVAMSIQWFVEERTTCKTVSPISHLLSTAYPFILYLFVLALSTLTRKAREHYNEARSVWLTLLTHLPLWIAWTSAAVVLDHRFNVICGLGLQGFVLLTLIVLLVPRSKYLTHLSRDGYNKFENDPYTYLHTDGGGFGYTSSKSSWEPSFTSWRSKEKESSSYLGFHRPTRVVPPSSSSLSHSTFSPGMIYPDRFAYVIPPPPVKPSYTSHRAVPTFSYLPASHYRGKQNLSTYKLPRYGDRIHGVGARLGFGDRSYRDYTSDYIF